MADETRKLAKPSGRALAEARSLGDLMAREYRERAEHYSREMSPAKAKKLARSAEGDDVALADQAPPSELSWWVLGRASEANPERGQAIWDRAVAEARDEVRGAQRSVNAAARDDKPWGRARYTALLWEFCEALRPTNAVEQALVESMAEARYYQLLWTERHAVLVKNDAERQDREVGRRGEWKPPTVDAATAIANSAQMIESFGRQVRESLRAFQELRGATASLNVRDVGQLNVAQAQVNVGQVEHADAQGDMPSLPSEDTARHHRRGRK